ncbi:hypothetical protein IMW82_08995 [Rhodanobacter sp. B2A1Ga4]|uniref:hypothetical protein n=1 Tax=Rhodanobacter TaxID=75309 RepID=UPI00131F30A7|nr:MULTISPECIES: hypothetical protein [Rhodanobacter]MBQ4854807.1 hypothetical protein [Rhodanobacter sp. B2A1Ga4]
MKFESQILAGLFVVCFAVCALVMGAMLTATLHPVQLAGADHAAVVVPAALAG